MSLAISKLTKRSSSLSREPTSESVAMDESEHPNPDNADEIEELYCREVVNKSDDKTKGLEKAKQATKKDLQNTKPEVKRQLARNFGVALSIVVVLYFINRLTELKI